MNVIPKIVVHGGAGNIRLKPEKAEPYKKAIIQALEEGLAVLTSDNPNIGSSKGLEAVAQAVSVLENSPLFNAGVGGVLNDSGQVECDASIMDGEGTAGGVANLTRVKNPILAAWEVLKDERHVLMAGGKAEEFVLGRGCQSLKPANFVTTERKRAWELLRGSQHSALDHSDPGSHGTVGAVAVDGRGRVYAATSTGGMTNKRAGRISDSSIIGAGTFADNRTCAVSATGMGEFFIKSSAAFQVHARILYSGVDLSHAMEQTIGEIGEAAGLGGLIGVDTRGNHAFHFNTIGMFRGVLDSNGQIWVGL